MSPPSPTAIIFPQELVACPFAMVGHKTQVASAEERIRALEQDFRSGGVKNANNVVELLKHVVPGAPGSSKAIHATRRVLKALEKPAEIEETFRKWLQQRRTDYAIALVTVLSSEAADDDEKMASIAAAALTHSSVWLHFLRSVLEGKASEKNTEIVLESFVAPYGDLRLGALELVREGVGGLNMCLRVLSYCAAPVDKGSVREQGNKVSEKELRKAFGAAWVAVVEDEDLLPKQRREILERVPNQLIPNMSDPLKLADFLNDSYNNGKDVSVAISALDGLFVLISKHGLDYPLFYPKLYALMSRDALFYAEGRKRFLELAAAFLRQGALLPGGMVAAFVKRLARRALLAPTEGALWCLRLALDLLYKHKNVSYLVHRSVNLFEAAGTDDEPPRQAEGISEPLGKKRVRTADLEDPYDDDELDPQASKADKSSLWELEVLKNHISPAVSRLVTSFSKDVRKNPTAPPGSLADYADLTFVDMFQAEFKRRSKLSHLAYDAPGSSPGLAEMEKKLGVCMEWA